MPTVAKSSKTLHAVGLSLVTYLAGLFWLWFDTDEDIQLLH